jgi:hypothetical protein
MKSKKYPKKFNKKYTKKRKQKKRLTKAKGLYDSFVSFTQPPAVARRESSINDLTIKNTIEREGELYVLTFLINHLYSKLKTRDEKIDFLADFQNLNNSNNL